MISDYQIIQGCGRRGRPGGGFTLVEVLVVVALAAGIGAMGISFWAGAIERNRCEQVRTELSVLTGALESFKSTYGDYPQTSDAVVFAEALLGLRGADGVPLAQPGRAFVETSRFRTSKRIAGDGRVTEVFIDPWETPYRYAYYRRGSGVGMLRAFVLLSAGPDGLSEPGVIPPTGQCAGELDATAPVNADNILSAP